MYFLMLPMVLVLGFIFIVPSVMRGVVNERETGIKVIELEVLQTEFLLRLSI